VRPERSGAGVHAELGLLVDPEVDALRIDEVPELVVDDVPDRGDQCGPAGLVLGHHVHGAAQGGSRGHEPKAVLPGLDVSVDRRHLVAELGSPRLRESGDRELVGTVEGNGIHEKPPATMTVTLVGQRIPGVISDR